MVEIINKQRKQPINLKKFEELIESLSRHYGFQETQITLAFVGSRAIRTLNRDFRKKDEVTDVLSFPIREKNPDGNFYLGDIIIAVPVAERQGAAHGHGTERELEILTVHGYLHLLGYKHFAGIEEEDEEACRLFLKGYQ
ncbi:MAG TPA: rRNA maturation RNase YbeY [Candidatus Aminicenantes bacterium]|nr:rRNA maturation RNase YbeY [Acidobacteriota bacterium]HOI44582.1 rRNA maturation RNase YbeY [Candidatus Aminicenantes bacterium]